MRIIISILGLSLAAMTSAGCATARPRGDRAASSRQSEGRVSASHLPVEGGDGEQPKSMDQGAPPAATQPAHDAAPSSPPH